MHVPCLIVLLAAHTALLSTPLYCDSGVQKGGRKPGFYTYVLCGIAETEQLRGHCEMLLFGENGVNGWLCRDNSANAIALLFRANSANSVNGA